MIALGLIILFIPLVYSIVLLALRKSGLTIPAFISVPVYSVSLVLSFILLFTLNGTSTLDMQSGSSELSLFKLSFTFTSDRVSAVILVFASLTALCISLFNLFAEEKQNNNSRRIYLALSVFGIIGLALAGNILVLFIFSGIIGFSAYVMIFREGKKLYLFKTILINFFSDIAFLTGILLIFSASKSFSFEEINKNILSGFFSGHLYTISGFCLLAGILAKSLVFPFHSWLTTKEKISVDSENIFLTLAMFPAGIIPAIRIFPVLPPAALYAMIWIGIISVIYGLILAGSKNNLRDTIKFLSISQAGLIFISIGLGDITAAVFLLITISISRLGLLLSNQLIDEQGNNKKNVLYYWLHLGSAIMFIGLPLASLSLGYNSLLKSILNYIYIIPGVNIIFSLFIFFSLSLIAFNVFKFVFRITEKNFVPSSVPSVPEILLVSAVSLLFISSLISRLLIYKNYISDKFSAEITGFSFPYPESGLVFFSIAIGVSAAYIFLSKKSLPGVDKFNIIENYFDNIFAEYLIPKQKTGIAEDTTTLSIDKVVAKYFGFDELSSYISFSLLLIVIFYFIFRNM